MKKTVFGILILLNLTNLYGYDYDSEEKNRKDRMEMEEKISSARRNYESAKYNYRQAELLDSELYERTGDRYMEDGNRDLQEAELLNH